MRKIFFGGIIILMMLSIFGCGRKKALDEVSAKKQMEIQLSKKYQKDFQIEQIQKEDIGQNFARYTYNAKAAEEGRSELFEVSIAADGTDFQDNYPKILYGGQLEQEALDILHSAEHVRVVFKGMEFPLLSKKSDGYEDYKENGNVTVNAEIEIEAETGKQAGEYAFAVLNRLEEAGFGYSVKLIYLEDSFYETYAAHLNINAATKEELIKRFERKQDLE